MNEQTETTSSKEISNYEEYLLMYFPEAKQNNHNLPKTPEEVGIKMAEETLVHIQNLLLENKTG